MVSNSPACCRSCHCRILTDWATFQRCMQASTKKGSKMTGLLKYRLRITINDGRQFVGQMLAFDKHMNLVIADTEEFRVLKKKHAKG